MATYEIIVTDVTCYGSLYCVAGWDRISNRMIRPEPQGANSRDEASRFWNAAYAGPGKTFSVGNVVRFDATNPLPDFLFPHATEDRIVDMGTPMHVLETLNPAAMVQAVAAGTAASLPLAFDNALVRVNSKAYVPTGNKGRSLGAIEIPPSDIIFFEHQWQNENPKLRARVTSAGRVYDLSVPAEAARTRWRSAGLAAVKADVKASTRVHIRAGLSRPMQSRPNECYSQLNGVILL
ncbi:dual OB domain-containing protein [Bradyrhizobium sp.]|uniref:dual OB domain-containing protein n=1 Tax=Bradyrhizobium sp. TaxID=376 RepID=UPI0040379936